VGVDYVLDERHEVLWHQPSLAGAALREDEDELAGLVVVGRRQAPPEVRELRVVEAVVLVAAGRHKYDALPVDRISASLEYLSQFFNGDG